MANIDVYMGGRAAEELVLGKENITGGASHDLQQATRIGKIAFKTGILEKF